MDKDNGKFDDNDGDDNHLDDNDHVDLILGIQAALSLGRTLDKRNPWQKHFLLELDQKIN